MTHFWTYTYIIFVCDPRLAISFNTSRPLMKGGIRQYKETFGYHPKGKKKKKVRIGWMIEEPKSTKR